MKTEESLSCLPVEHVKQDAWPVPTFIKVARPRPSLTKPSVTTNDIPYLPRLITVPRKSTLIAGVKVDRNRHASIDYGQDSNSAYYRSGLSSHSTPLAHPLQGASTRQLSTSRLFHSFDSPRALGEVVPTPHNTPPAQPPWAFVESYIFQPSPLSSWSPLSASTGSSDQSVRFHRSSQRNDHFQVPSTTAVGPVTLRRSDPYPLPAKGINIKPGGIYPESRYRGPLPTRPRSKEHLTQTPNMDVLDVSPGWAVLCFLEPGKLTALPSEQLVHDDMTAEDRPAICRFNPVHPDYLRAISAGEIPDHIQCTKRFTRKSDCARHERIHTGHR
jgi:hypothetical protein